jgi:hypothetical protein
MIKKLGGWANFIGVLILIVGISYGIIRKQIRINKSCFVIGESEGLKKGVKGNIHLYYFFKVDGILYEGSVPNNFCKKCKSCCDIGETVLVRFQSGNPKNSDLVESLPNGVSLDGNDTYCTD